MPYTEAEQAIVDAVAEINPRCQRAEYAPSREQKIRRYEVMALILNRTIGSGIFLTPHRIIAGAGSVGGSLCLWAGGCVIALCGLLVWLECGLSIPQRRVRGETEPRGVPRSGGEKNYLEFMFPSPKYRTTCMFGIMFLILGNLSGNAISFGQQVLIASGQYTPTRTGPPPDKATVSGIAIAALSGVVALHIFSRRGGIVLNNAFAIFKVALLLVIVFLGFAKAAGHFGGNAPLDNFTKGVFQTKRRDVASYSDSLLYVLYSLSGFEQPFYVLAETKSPRKVFPKYTIMAMIVTSILFLLVNISFLLAVRLDEIIPESGPLPNNDIATLFLQSLFSDSDKARRAMSALIATSILGNLVVMTFTAARVKQEIAKEGILPYSLFFANSHTTPYGLLKYKLASLKKDASPKLLSTSLDTRLEQSPMAALLLHWFTTVFLILITLPIHDVRVSYALLVALYSYTIVIICGAWTSIGLLLLKYRKSTYHWQSRRRWSPPRYISPLHAIIYGSACMFVMIASFSPPSLGSPYHESVTNLPWYIAPTIGITAPFWGLLWYYGLLFVQRRRKRDLQVDRKAYWRKDPDDENEYVQRAEIITHDWQPRRYQVRDDEDGLNDDDNSSHNDGMALRSRRKWWSSSAAKTAPISGTSVADDNDDDDDENSNSRYQEAEDERRRPESQPSNNIVTKTYTRVHGERRNSDDDNDDNDSDYGNRNAYRPVMPSIPHLNGRVPNQQEEEERRQNSGRRW